MALRIEPNPDVREVLHEAFLDRMRKDPDFNAMSFEITRADRKNLFPSAEAMDRLFDQLAAFIGANLMADYERTGRTASKYKFTLEIEKEGNDG